MSSTFYLNGSFYASSIADFIRNPSFIVDQTMVVPLNFGHPLKLTMKMTSCCVN